MDLSSRIVVLLASVFSFLVFGWRLRDFIRLARPTDKALPKGNLQNGILYAFTVGMAPWAKESTRKHMLAYLRGIAFHLGIFLGLGILLISPWISRVSLSFRYFLAISTGLGAICGLMGLAARLFEVNLKSLSTMDDYFAVMIVTLYLSTATMWLLFPQLLPLFYIMGALLLIYAPFGKIRHCIYFAFSRLFFGKFIGSRAVLPHVQRVVR